MSLLGKEDLLKVVVQQEERLPGLDDILLDSETEPLTTDPLAEVEQKLAQSDFPVESVMGFGDSLRYLIDRFRGRRFIRDLPEVVHPVTWMEFHIPTTGSGVLGTTTSVTGEHAIEMSLFGSGFGTGRKISLSFEDSTDSRKNCVRYAVFVKVKPKVYQTKEGDTVVLDVEEVAGEASQAFNPCPYCGVQPSQIDRFEHRLGPFLDLRQDTVERKRTFETEQVTNRNMKLGISIPSLETPLNLSVKLTIERVWKVDYEFKPGLLYQPYWRLSGVPPHTPMWAAEAKS
jgi:hypothetical protein